VLRDEPRVPPEVYDRHECCWVQLDRTPCYEVRPSVVLTSEMWPLLVSGYMRLAVVPTATRGHFLFLATCGAGQLRNCCWPCAQHIWPLVATETHWWWATLAGHLLRMLATSRLSAYPALMAPSTRSTRGTIQVPRATCVQHKVAVPVRGRRGVGPARVASSRGRVGKACTVPGAKL
jgi:hypothetical protein